MILEEIEVLFNILENAAALLFRNLLANNAGIKKPLQVKMKIFVLPIITSEKANTAKVSQKACLLAK